MTHDEFKQLVSDAIKFGLDVKVIADKLEVAPGTIHRWVAGTSKPRAGILSVLSQELKELMKKYNVRFEPTNSKN